MTTVPRRYVYGVIRSDTPLPEPTALVEPSEGTILKTSHHNVAALVSVLAAQRVRPTRANLHAHQGVIEDATRLGTVIPMRFGVVVDSEQALISDFLEPQRHALVKLLREYDKHVEMRIEARYREGVAVREAAETEPRIGRLRRRMRGKPPAATYYDRLALGELVAAAIERRTENDARQIGAALASVARRARRLSPTSGDAVFRGAFLIRNSESDRFDQWLAELAKRQANRMTFEVVGPLAPWDFVDLHLSDPVAQQGHPVAGAAAR